MYPMQGDAVVSSIKTITVTISANGTSGSTVHNMGKTPTILGRPNPSSEDGYETRASVDGTNVTVTSNTPIANETTFTVSLI